MANETCRALGEIMTRIDEIAPLDHEGRPDTDRDPFYVRRGTLLSFLPFDRIQVLYPAITRPDDVRQGVREWVVADRGFAHIAALIGAELAQMSMLAYRHDGDRVRRHLGRLNELVWMHSWEMDLFQMPFSQYAMPAVASVMRHYPFLHVLGVEQEVVGTELRNEQWFLRMAAGAPCRTECQKGCYGD